MILKNTDDEQQTATDAEFA